MDLATTIEVMRKGGVERAEFHENGTPKVIELGPDPDAGGGDEGDERPENPLKRRARNLMSGRREDPSV